MLRGGIIAVRERFRNAEAKGRKTEGGGHGGTVVH